MKLAAAIAQSGEERGAAFAADDIGVRLAEILKGVVDRGGELRSDRAENTAAGFLDFRDAVGRVERW